MRAVLLSVTALLVAVGCAPTSGYPKCDQVCDSYNACALDQRPQDIECVDFCGLHNTASNAGNCRAEFEAHLDCWESNEAKICDKTFTDCATAFAPYKTCMDTYCASVAANEGFDQACSAAGKFVLTGI